MTIIHKHEINKKFISSYLLIRIAHAVPRMKELKKLFLREYPISLIAPHNLRKKNKIADTVRSASETYTHVAVKFD